MYMYLRNYSGEGVSNGVNMLYTEKDTPSPYILVMELFMKSRTVLRQQDLDFYIQLGI